MWSIFFSVQQVRNILPKGKRVIALFTDSCVIKIVSDGPLDDGSNLLRTNLLGVKELYGEEYVFVL